MRKILKTLLPTVAISLSIIGLTGCNNNNETPSEETIIEYSRSNPMTAELNGEDSPTIPLVGPFTILDADGNDVVLEKDEDGYSFGTVPSTYDNMYKAIRIAGANSTGSNPLQVQDSNFVQIFKRVKRSQTYVFNGHDYVGTALESPAKQYCLSHKDAYAINGLGSDYYYLGRDDYGDPSIANEETLETFSGAYNYMFSKAGDAGKTGFSYATATVRLSETVYAPANDGGQWNAYIFINFSNGLIVDLGLIGGFNPNTKVCQWKLVRNCSSKEHTVGTGGSENTARFYVYHDKVVTESKYYNEETRECTGFDDLQFECFMRSDGWTTNITNLTTGVVYSFEDNHTDAQGNPLIENASTQFGRVLLAASYCPVTANVWNWDCGAKLTNVLFENVLITRRIVGENMDNIEAYRDESLEREEFYPDTPNFHYGYSQGGFRASYEFGTHEEDGTYKSGATYKKGSKYIIYNVDYND